MAKLFPAVAVPLWGAPDRAKMAAKASIERPAGPLLQNSEHG